MFNNNKFPKLGALKGKKADEVTQEMITEANEELKAAGIAGFVMVSSENYPTANAITDALTAAEAAEEELNTANSRVEELESEVETLTTERDDLQTQVEELGGEGEGATKTRSSKTKDPDKDKKNEFHCEADELLEAELKNQPL